MSERDGFNDYLSDIADDETDQDLHGGNDKAEVEISCRTKFRVDDDSDDSGSDNHVLVESIATRNFDDAGHPKLAADELGLVSPFLTNSRTVPSTKENLPHLSLSPCRKVSAVVRVMPPKNTQEQQCLFPLVLHQRSMYQNMETKELVLVNPSAFGKHIPARVTMDTARLVAQVAHVESEDWARLLQYDEVLWPESTHLEKLGQAMANDVLRNKSPSVCFNLGGGNDKTRSTLLGNIVTPRRQGQRSSSNDKYKFGLLGMTLEQLWQQGQVVCTLSLLEIVEEDKLRDLLATQYDPYLSKTPSPLQIRHPDSDGAVVYNLTEMPVDSQSGLETLLERAFHTSSAIRARRREGSRGHIVATLKVWQSTATDESSSDETDCTILGFVDLNGGESDERVANGLYSERKRHERRVSSIRKSLSGLRGVLRGLLLQDHTEGTANPLPFRECTLTKVLQRVLNHPDSRAVVISTVCPCSESYHQTLQTLTWSHRLLVRPGNTARSPFTTDMRSPNGCASPPLDKFTNEESLLKSVLSDPRQRLAKLITGSPMRPSEKSPEVVLEDDYVPNDYMKIDSRIMDKILSGPKKSQKSDKKDVVSSVKRVLRNELEGEVDATRKNYQEESVGMASPNEFEGLARLGNEGSLEGFSRELEESNFVSTVTPGEQSQVVQHHGEAPEPLLFENEGLVTYKEPSAVNHGGLNAPTVSESDESARSPVEMNKSGVRDSPHAGGESGGHVVGASEATHTWTKSKELSQHERSPSSDSGLQYSSGFTSDGANDGFAQYNEKSTMRAVFRDSHPANDGNNELRRDFGGKQSRNRNEAVEEVEAKSSSKAHQASAIAESTEFVEQRTRREMDSFDNEKMDEVPGTLPKDQLVSTVGDADEMLQSPRLAYFERSQKNDDYIPSMSQRIGSSEVDEIDRYEGSNDKASESEGSGAFNAVPQSDDRAFTMERLGTDFDTSEAAEDNLAGGRSGQMPPLAEFSSNKTRTGNVSVADQERFDDNIKGPATQLRTASGDFEHSPRDGGILGDTSSSYARLGNEGERRSTAEGWVERERSAKQSVEIEQFSFESRGAETRPSGRVQNDQQDNAIDRGPIEQEKETAETDFSQLDHGLSKSDEFPTQQYRDGNQQQFVQEGGMRSMRQTPCSRNLERPHGNLRPEEGHFSIRSEDDRNRLDDDFVVSSSHLETFVDRRNIQQELSSSEADRVDGTGNFKTNYTPRSKNRLEARPATTGLVQVVKSAADSRTAEGQFSIRMEDYRNGSGEQDEVSYAFSNIRPVTQDHGVSGVDDSVRYNEKAEVARENRTATAFDLSLELESEIRRSSNETELDLRDGTFEQHEVDTRREFITETERSSSDVIDEISVLESVVDEFKRMQRIHSSGLCESSTNSLEKLREAYLSNQQLLRKAVSARIEAEKDAEATRETLTRQRQHHADELRLCQQDILDLEKRFNQAVDDRFAMEKIAEDAIAGQDKLEKSVDRLNDQLLSSQMEAAELKSKNDDLFDSADSLSRKLQAAEDAVSTMELEKAQLEIKIVHLEETVRRLESDKSRLNDASAQGKEKLEELLQAANFHEDAKRELHSLKDEVSRLKLDNEELNAALDQHNHYAARFVEVESELEQVRYEARSLRSELQSSRDSFERESSEMKVELQSLWEERSHLRTELSKTNRTLQDTRSSLSEALKAKEDALSQAAEERRARFENEEEIKQQAGELARLSVGRENDKEHINRLQHVCEELQKVSETEEAKVELEKETASALLEKSAEDSRAQMDENVRLREAIEKLQTELDSVQESRDAYREQAAAEYSTRNDAEECCATLQLKLDESQETIRRLGEEARQMEVSMSRIEAERAGSQTESEARLLEELKAERRKCSVLRTKVGELQEAVTQSKQPSAGQEAADLQRENELLKSFVASPRQLLTPYEDSRGAVALGIFHTEQRRRIQAEELAAAMAARAKTGLEMRSKEIVDLRMRLSAVAEEKESEINRLRAKLHTMETNKWRRESR